MTEYLLLGLISAPEALRVQTLYLVVAQATKERDVPQCFQLSPSGSKSHDASPAASVFIRKWVAVEHPFGTLPRVAAEMGCMC